MIPLGPGQSELVGAAQTCVSGATRPTSVMGRLLTSHYNSDVALLLVC
jgi:hypothetical protein